MYLFAAGSYTSHSMVNSRGSGISVYSMNSEGRCRLIGVNSGVENPSFLHWDKISKTLFAVSEMEENSGSVVSLSVDTEKLLRSGGGEGIEILSVRKGPGKDGCHIISVPRKKLLGAAAYSGGSAAFYPLDGNGIIGSESIGYEYSGSGPDKSRQEKAHAHQIVPAPDAGFIFTVDLGSDTIWRHKTAEKYSGRIVSEPEATLKLPGGFGPRHMVFSPDGSKAYILCELKPYLTTADYSRETGDFRITDSVLTVPENNVLSEKTAPAAIKVHPSGKTIAVSNRFHDSISIFDISESRVFPVLVENFSSAGKIPRDISFSPDGRFLLAANQDSHNITVFRFDRVTGLPEKEKPQPVHNFQSGSPVCIVFLQ